MIDVCYCKHTDTPSSDYICSDIMVTSSVKTYEVYPNVKDEERLMISVVYDSAGGVYLWLE